MKRLSERLAAKPRHFQRHYLQRPDRLIRSEQFEKYCQCLSDYEFVEAKVQHPEFGVQALIEDYDWLNDAEVTATLDPETVRALQLIQGALRLSAHVLERDVTQLAGHLWGRLLPHDLPHVHRLLDTAKATPISPRLRPITASLTPSGSALLRTLSGHSDWVNGPATVKSGGSQ
ncbi:hypothetical protein [Sodalinema gerasimenkoae]|uniref:hypothetical protein n=1 Tax=Sodalinema gerasimenkoae TaxID=2862348 RepID=UPI00135818D8|nr:hypothetical protein [Sodalinema gerasimenkoae]